MTPKQQSIEALDRSLAGKLRTIKAALEIDLPEDDNLHTLLDWCIYEAVLLSDQGSGVIESGKALNDIIIHAQRILAEYLVPDGMSKEDALDLLLGLLDGPDQREAQAAWDRAVKDGGQGDDGDGVPQKYKQMPVVVVGDAAKSGPGSPAVSSADGRTPPSIPIAPAHTPLPWMWIPQPSDETRRAALFGGGYDDAECVVFHAANWDVSKANAEFIVRACNHHQELLRVGDRLYESAKALRNANKARRAWEALRAGAQGIRAAAESGSESSRTEPAPSPVAVIGDAPKEDEQRSPTS